MRLLILLCLITTPALARDERALARECGRGLEWPVLRKTEPLPPPKNGKITTKPQKGPNWPLPC